MKSIQLPLAVAASLCLLFSCGNKEKNKAQDIVLENFKKEENKKPVLSDEEKGIAGNEFFKTDTATIPQLSPEQKETPKNTPQPRIDWDKKIIKDATINAEVKNYAGFYSSLRGKVKNLGGYVAQEEQNQSEYKIENSIVIKVPVDKFDDAVSLLTTGIDKVNEKKITSQDVTSEYIDTKSRMQAKKEMRDRYLDFLKQAKNIKDVLSVQSEINDIQEEIESATNQVNYLSHSSSFSTINFTFYQVLSVPASDYKDPSFLTKVGESFKIGWKWTGGLIISLISIWPALLFFMGVWLVIRKYTRPKVKSVKVNS